MINEQADNTAKWVTQANRNTVESRCYEIVREVYQTIARSGLNNFTYSFIDSLWNDLNIVVYELDRLPEPAFKKLIGVIGGLNEARNELRLARFLFDVKEINAVHSLVMRNRAVLRGKDMLCRILQVWSEKQTVNK